MKSQRDSQRKASSARVYVAVMGYTVLFGKLIMANWLEQGIWIDGDGLKRAAELEAMAVYGVAVPGLNMATAGYSTLVHGFGELIGNSALWPVALLQSAIFSAAVWYFTIALSRTRIAWATIPLAYLILLNPALSLSSLALTGESVTAALLMFALGQLVRDMLTPRNARTPRRILIAALLLSVATLLAPALAFGSIAFLLSWAAARGNREQAIWVSSGALALLLALPLMLLVRNQIANNSALLPESSEQLAPVMSGFKDFNGQRCGVGKLDVVSLNGSTLRCLMTWYQEASASSSASAVPNAIAFWSPWAGPMAGPHLRENPWVALQPANVLGNAQDDRSLLGSPLASLASWLWVLGGWVALAAGLFALRSLGPLETQLSAGAGWLIAGLWLVGTLAGADSSSRLPVQGAALLLQLMGWRFIFTRGRETSRDPFAPS